MRLLAAAIGAVVLCLLAVGGVAAYRAMTRFADPLPPERGLAQPVAPTRRKVATSQPVVAVERPPCPITPEPKVYKEQGRSAELLDAAAIVVGSQAAEPERYAAERLQGLVERRFRRKLPVCSDEELESGRQPAVGSRQVILLGQRGTNARLDRLCREKSIELSAESPGHDGFVIEVIEESGRQLVLIGGSNDRGVVYGQDAFFDLLRREGERVVFPVVSVRDWPSIAWRGRVHGKMTHYLQPGVLDAFVRARLNWLDLRNSPAPRGEFGFAPGEPLPRDDVSAVVAQAHRRGVFVAGTVSCSFAAKEPLQVERTFAALRELGVDGFVVDFNDLGAPKGSEELVRRALACADRLGVRGRAVATVPPTGSYQHVKTEYSQAMVKVPGFGEATWFFTAVPGRQWADAAREVGLKHPAWWHNWPRTEPGLLHRHYGGRSLRVGEKAAYLDLQPLSAGWGSPKYDELRTAPKCTDTVIYSGLWPEETVGVTFGVWAWHPERHDWARTCQAVRAYTFGPSGTGAAQRFDAALAGLKALFVLPQTNVVPGYNWPPRLRRTEDRPEALRLLDDMQAALEKLEASAPGETAVEPERLRTCFLEPMRATVAAGRRLAAYEHPGQRMVELEDQLLALLAEGESAAAEREFLQARGPLLQLVGEAESATAELQMTKEWLAELRGRLEGFAYWPALAQRRQEEIRTAFGRLFPKGATASRFSAVFGKPPQRQALAELRPSEWLQRPIVARGLWTAGVLSASSQAMDGPAKEPGQVQDPQSATGNRQSDMADALAVVHTSPAGWRPVERGEYAELRAEMAVPNREGPLTFQVPLAIEAKGVREGHIAVELWANGRRVLEHDAALGCAEGEWLDVGATEAAKGAGRLKLRLRVTNRGMAARFHAAVYLGSVRLLSGEPATSRGRPLSLPTGGEGADGR